MKTNLFQKVILAAFVGAVGAVIVSTIGRPASEPSVPQAGKDIRELTEVHGQPLETIKLKSGKVVHAFAVAGDLDPATLVSNTFELEWPPRSGRMQAFPEVDRAGWFDLATAREKLNPAQAAFVDRLEALLGA